jgi:para-nitrobenzyl esterase
VLDAARQVGVDDLFTAPASRLVEAGYVAALTSPYADTLFAPYVDGDLVIGEPYELLRAGHAAGISLMAGATQDEMGYWSMYDSQLRNYFAEESDFGPPIGLPARIRSSLDAALAPATLDGIYAEWVAEHDPPRGRRDDAATILLAQVDDYVMIQPMTRLAEAQLDHAPAFLYRFAWKVPTHALESPQQDLGAIHALELSFVFGTEDIIAPGGDRLLADPLQRARIEALSLTMRQAWTNFARTGDPNGGGVPHWPPYDLADRPTLVWRNDAAGELTTALVHDPDRVRREAWLTHPFPPFGAPPPSRSYGPFDSVGEIATGGA